MTHLPFIVAAYTIGIGGPFIFAIAAWQRLRLAQRRLAAIDPRNRDLMARP